MTKREEFELQYIQDVGLELFFPYDNQYTYLIYLQHRKDLLAYMLWKEYYLVFKNSELFSGFVKNDAYIEDAMPYNQKIFDRNYIENSPENFAKEIKLIQKNIK